MPVIRPGDVLIKDNSNQITVTKVIINHGNPLKTKNGNHITTMYECVDKYEVRSMLYDYIVEPSGQEDASICTVFEQGWIKHNDIKDFKSEYNTFKNNNFITAPYKAAIKGCIHNIPGFQHNEEIDDLIDKHTDAAIDNCINNIDYFQNLEGGDKNEMMMLGLLTMAGVMAMITKK